MNNFSTSLIVDIFASFSATVIIIVCYFHLPFNYESCSGKVLNSKGVKKGVGLPYHLIASAML